MKINKSVLLIYLIVVLFLFYILHINNILLSYKIYNNNKFNDYDKIMLKITSVLQSIIFVFLILYYIYNYKFIIDIYKYIINNLNNINNDFIYQIFYIIIILLYYGNSFYINYKNFNNEFNLNNINDEKNKILKYHIYISIPVLFLFIIYIYKLYIKTNI